MRATRNFMAHNDDGDTRRFKRDEKIPGEWVPFIGSQSLVDSALPHLVGDDGEPAGAPVPRPDQFPEYADLSTVDDVVVWMGSGSNFEDRMARARHALERETAGRGRKGIIEAAEDYLANE